MTQHSADKAPKDHALKAESSKGKSPGKPGSTDADTLDKAGVLKAPAIAVEQLAEALEERQLPDQRRKKEQIEFDDRRQVKRRASDLS